MNPLFKGGDVATLKELIPYEADTVAKKEIASNAGMKLILMAFDAGEKLSPHRAPANAILTILEGEGKVDYEGDAHELKAGDMIYFEEGGLHSVEAKGKMKMALMLMA
ncbi:cupin domain protein [Aedoeadaptatus coxii]|uniref:cupin domain-containing protein n=1 Tax=Aedoeadaptatus coxii TaxID=755172 RepID=UPI0017571FE3|nr:cupin domain-containing protein [Peptoniphilus coxii]CAC9933657.1 cupin domain protein [Peptoniphilus coxii]